MVRLIGRRVQMIPASLSVKEGVVYADQPEGVWVRFEDGAAKYIAKWRLLCNEFAESEVPSEQGYYLIDDYDQLVCPEISFEELFGVA